VIVAADRFDPADSDPSRPALDAERLRAALSTHGRWTQVRLAQQTGSTNADVVAAARAGAPEGLVITAERQHAGRGRLGRSWQSPARAGLAVSVLLRPDRIPPARYGWLPLLAGVALADLVETECGLAAGLKWPNDLLIEERKCAGVLAELVPGRAEPGDRVGGVGQPVGVVLGIGLNVSLRVDELPHPLATSLELAGSRSTDRQALLVGLLDRIADWYGRWHTAGGDADACGLRERYQSRCVTLGRRIRIDPLTAPGSPTGDQPGGDHTALAAGIDAAGQLILREADTLRAVAAGDVWHVRQPVR